MSSKRKIEELNPQDNLDNSPNKHPRLQPSSTISSKLSYPAPSSPATTPQFQQPLPLLTFSYTPTRTLEFTDSALRYFVDPPREADLNFGVERWTRRPEERGRLDGLLRALGKVTSAGGVRDVGVVTWRGVMTKYFFFAI